MADLNPTPQEVTGKEPGLRTAFKKKYDENIQKGLYDARDIQRLDSEDAYARCFLRTLKTRGDVDKSADLVHDCFKFRKEFSLNDLTANSFPSELTDKKAIYYQGTDIQGHPILYINVKENTAAAEHAQLLKQYIAWSFDQHQKKDPEVMCVVLMDMSGAGTGNINTDMTKFIISCFSTNFPTFLAYMINYELPFLLSATWTVISAFLSSEQKKKLLMVKKKDIGKYIAVEHQWPHMKE